MSLAQWRVTGIMAVSLTDQRLLLPCEEKIELYPVFDQSGGI